MRMSVQAVINAIHDAVGVGIHEFPATHEVARKALTEAEHKQIDAEIKIKSICNPLLIFVNYLCNLGHF